MLKTNVEFTLKNLNVMFPDMDVNKCDCLKIGPFNVIVNRYSVTVASAEQELSVRGCFELLRAHHLIDGRRSYVYVDRMSTSPMTLCAVFKEVRI